MKKRFFAFAITVALVLVANPVATTQPKTQPKTQLKIKLEKLGTKKPTNGLVAVPFLCNTNSCRCNGVLDCWDMGRSGVCAQQPVCGANENECTCGR